MCLCQYREKIFGSIDHATAFANPPIFDFLSKEKFCPHDNTRLNVHKTTTRTKRTIRIGSFIAHETIRVCPLCGTYYRSNELARMVPFFCNFGYDILVYVGKALFVGLNDGDVPIRINTIEKKVKLFRNKIANSKEYERNKRHQKMIEQIDTYWEKLFADPIEVTTSKGKKHIVPQRTNNFAEQHFRDLKRGYRKKTGNGSLGKTLQTMLANTPLVKNLQNDEYMKILLNGNSSLEKLFADIDAAEVRNELKNAQENVDKIPAKIKKLTNKQDYPEILKKYFLKLKSNRILW